MNTVYTHVVLKSFETLGRILEPGAAVNASEWKNTEMLVNTKYLRPINQADLIRLRKTRPAAQQSTSTSKRRFFKKTR